MSAFRLLAVGVCATMSFLCNAAATFFCRSHLQLPYVRNILDERISGFPTNTSNSFQTLLMTLLYNITNSFTTSLTERFVLHNAMLDSRAATDVLTLLVRTLTSTDQAFLPCFVQ
jgi:hypothetical protein